jgi:hypothetical protein
MLNLPKSKSVFARIKDKWSKFTILGFLGALIIVGLVVGLNALNHYFKIAQAYCRNSSGEWKLYSKFDTFTR